MTQDSQKSQDPKEMSRDFKGIWIPREIWFAPISFMEKALWAEIHSLFDRDRGGCYASNDYLCNFLGIKERRLQECLANLKGLGYIEYVSFDGRQRVLRSLIPKEDAETQTPENQRFEDSHHRGAEKCTPEMQKSAPLSYIERKGKRKEKQTPPNAPLSLAAAADSQPRFPAELACSAACFSLKKKEDGGQQRVVADLGKPKSHGIQTAALLEGIELLCAEAESELEDAVPEGVREAGGKEKDADLIYDCLKGLSIPEEEKRWLSGRYDEERVKDAVGFSLHSTTAIRTCLLKTLKWACKERKHPPPSQDTGVAPKLSGEPENVNLSDVEKTPIYGILEEVKIPDFEKRFLTKNYTEDVVSKAVAFVMDPNFKVKKSVSQSMKWYCRENSGVDESVCETNSVEKVVEFNKSKIENNFKKCSKDVFGYIYSNSMTRFMFDLFPDRLVISCATQEESFYYNVVSCCDQVRKFLSAHFSNLISEKGFVW